MLEYDGLVDCFLGRMRNGYKVCRAKISEWALTYMEE